MALDYIERALGQQWNIDTDTFGVKTSPPSARPRSDTRRRCLSTLSSIFDPLGMIGPVLLPAKRVLQKTWQLKLLWDEKLPEDLLKDWNKWKENLTLLNRVTIPRCYFPGGCSLDTTSLQRCVRGWIWNCLVLEKRNCRRKS